MMNAQIRFLSLEKMTDMSNGVAVLFLNKHVNVSTQINWRRYCTNSNSSREKRVQVYVNLEIGCICLRHLLLIRKVNCLSTEIIVGIWLKFSTMSVLDHVVDIHGCQVPEPKVKDEEVRRDNVRK